MNLQFITNIFATIFQRTGIHSIVEVPRRLAVDGDNGQLAKIATTCVERWIFFWWNGYRASFLQHAVRKDMRQMMLADEDFDVHAKGITVAENFDHAATRCGVSASASP